MGTAGLLLAAGAGVRAGGPKALRRFEDGVSWLERSAATLRDGGCDPVVVVVGASAAQVSTLVPDWARTVVAEDWAEGMGASLRAGLRALLDDEGHPGNEAALIGLVDTPGVTPAVVSRLLERATPSVLARAAYRGEPGHPVLIGRDHWAAVAVTARGDVGARSYLASREARTVECGDLGSGEDRDTAGPGLT